MCNKLIAAKFQNILNKTWIVLRNQHLKNKSDSQTIVKTEVLVRWDQTTNEHKQPTKRLVGNPVINNEYKQQIRDDDKNNG